MGVKQLKLSGHLENQKQNGSETVETEWKIAGEKKKEKSGENVVETGWC